MKPQRPQRNTLRTLKEYPFKDITEKIISCAIEVHSSLGPGLLENLYEEAMEHELKSRGIEYKRQKELEIKYKGNPIGNYRLDYLIENKVIVELKCVEAMNLPAAEQRGIKSSFRKAQRAYPESRFPLSRE